MIELVAATNNKKKLAEITRILAPMEFKVRSLAEMGLHIQPEETAGTFAGNARIKAQAVFAACGLPTVADDSGLLVKALGGEPGVYSARYGGEGLSDEARCRYLLEKLAGVPEGERGASFFCAICCVVDKDIMLECSGECPGAIALAPSGEGGFGYDPIFLAGGKSFSAYSPQEKDEMSHRGRALRNLREMLRPYMGTRL